MRLFRVCLVLGAVALLPLHAQAAVILSPHSAGWEYTFADPTGDPTWNTSTGLGGPFGWASGAAPFGNTVGGDFGANTIWPADGADGDDLWVRHAVDLTGFNLASITWDLGVDNGYKLYMNGTLVSSANAEGFTSRWEYSGAFGGLLVPGVNVLAVALEDHGGLTAFDMQVSGDRAVTSAPEPASALLLLTALAGARLARRRGNTVQ